MAQSPLVLKVIEGSKCSLLSEGDHYVFEKHEIRPGTGTRICGPGICSLFIKVREWRRRSSMGLETDSASMKCGEKGCDVVFQLSKQIVTKGVRLDKPAPLQPRAKSATTMLQKAGPFLSRISPETAVHLVTACTTNRFENGEIILEEGIQGKALYIVGDGEVEVVQSSVKNPGKKTVLAVLGMGECFGEMSLLTGQATSATIRARGSAAILVLSEALFEEELARSPELNRVFSKLLADRLRVQNVMLEHELARGIRGRFSMMSLPDLVQTLHGAQRTGTLVVQHEEQEGRLMFDQGKLIAAHWDVMSGDDVLFEMNSWKDGEFCFEPGNTNHQSDHRVRRDTMTLLMECARRQDEQGKA